MNKRLIKSNDEGGVGASFNTVTYTGNASTLPITGVGFEPDFVWIKQRSYADSHNLWDRVRGLNNYLITNVTSAALSKTNGVTSLDTDGFTLGNWDTANTSGQNYVAWCWKAAGYANTFNVLENGSTTSSATAAGAGITAGTYTTNYSVSANRDAGFSIVKYNKPVSTSGTVGHGLNTTPQLIIGKSIDVSENWSVNTSVIDGSWDYAVLNQTDQFNNSSLSSPNSSIFYASAGASTSDYIAYCFAEVAGFSKFGSYVGNGGSQTISLGFEPKFVIIKCSSAGESYRNWFMLYKDGSSMKAVIANGSGAEFDQTGTITFNANDFNINCGGCGEYNQSGQTYIYMAFANQF